jgi:hypothetical protein
MLMLAVIVVMVNVGDIESKTLGGVAATISGLFTIVDHVGCVPSLLTSWWGQGEASMTTSLILELLDGGVDRNLGVFLRVVLEEGEEGKAGYTRQEKRRRCLQTTSSSCACT